MKVQRSIRVMSREELRAKRDWGTSGCQAEGCTARAGYLVMEMAKGEAGDEWWQYCCPDHARAFAEQYDLRLPAAVYLGGEGADPHKPAA